uniref:Efflux transporter, RND family, MFP subunit n=1 Tax=Solibacter usitatus (strain Ellin6076) TaxID=234267 RepID=Q01VQ2_SOLUE
MPKLVARGPGSPRHSMKLLSALGVSAVLALALCGCSGSSTAAKSDAPGGGGKGGGRRGGGDVPVTVAKAKERDVPVEIQVIGNVEAYSTITVKAQVGGLLTDVYFHEGDFVKKGEKLFAIDRRPLEAAYNQALANIARDQASLGQARANLARDEAQAKYQDTQAKRYAALNESGVISKDQAEQLRASADAMAQAVNADKAAIQSAQAAIGASQATAENAKVQMGFTDIYSPINGRTGNLTVKTGNVVTANNMDMMTINQVEPIYVTFSVPEAQLPSIKKYKDMGVLSVRARPQDAETAVNDETGSLTFIDNTVDMTTGTIKLKGTFPNSNHQLWPGQFVRVTLRLTTQKNAVVVPNEAVQTGQTGSFVYVVKPDMKVESRTVTTGARVDQDMVVDGLELGETVVTEGQLRLAPGSKVSIKDASGGGRGGGGRGRSRG